MQNSLFIAITIILLIIIILYIGIKDPGERKAKNRYNNITDEARKLRE
jgi:hypothetical protein